MSQPKLSMTNAEAVKLYPQLAKPGESPVIVVAIGDLRPTKAGEQVPVLMMQKTSRFNKQTSFAEFARGWGGKLIRHIENFTLAAIDGQGIAKGKEIPGATINLKRSFEPIYEGQTNLQAPIDGELTDVTSGGRLVYQGTFVDFGGPKDQGMEIVLDRIQTEATIGTEVEG